MGNANAQSEWKHTVVPLYFWVSGIQGTIQLGPVNALILIEFEDALDNQNTTLTVHYETNKGQWGVLADVFHLSLDPEGYLANDAPAGVDLTNNISEPGAIYRPNLI